MTRHLLGPFGVEPDDARQVQDEMETELRWVNCEACGGSGEIIRVVPVSTYEAPYEYPEICGACEGTGRDCVTVTPITADDLDQPST